MENLSTSMNLKANNIFNLLFLNYFFNDYSSAATSRVTWLSALVEQKSYFHNNVYDTC